MMINEVMLSANKCGILDKNTFSASGYLVREIGESIWVEEVLEILDACEQAGIPVSNEMYTLIAERHDIDMLNY